MFRMKSLVLSLSISLALALVTTVEAQNPQLIFEKDIKPILLTYCYECHNAELQEGKVRLDNLNPDLVAGPDAQRTMGRGIAVPGSRNAAYRSRGLSVGGRVGMDGAAFGFRTSVRFYAGRGSLEAGRIGCERSEPATEIRGTGQDWRWQRDC